MATGYGQEIRELDRAYAEQGGKHVFIGVEHRGGQGAPNLYMFTDATFTNGPEALGHMREKIRELQRQQRNA